MSISTGIAVLRHIRSSRLYKVVSFICCTAISFVVLYNLNSHSIYVLDDLFKQMSLPEVSSFGSALHYYKNFYLTWGGRVWGEVFAMTFLGLPKHIFNAINSVGYVLLILLIYVNITGRFVWSTSLFMSITALLLLSVPAYGQDFFWVSGAANYLWPSLIWLLYLAVFRFYLESAKLHFQTPLALLFILLLSIFAGWQNENISPTLVLITGYYMYIFKKDSCKIPAFSIVAMVGLFLGFAGLVAAPGNIVRFEVENHSAGIVRILSDALLNMKLLIGFEVAFIPFISICILAPLTCSASNLNKTWSLGICFMLASFFSAAAFALIGHLYTRTYFGSVVLMIISAGILISMSMNGKSSQLALIKVGIIAACTIYSFTCLDSALYGMNNYAYAWSVNQQKIDRSKQSGNLDVYINQIHPENKFVAAYGLELVYDKNGNNLWPNTYYAELYGLNTIQVVTADDVQLGFLQISF